VRWPAVAAAGAVAIVAIAVAVTGVLPGSAAQSHPVSAGTSAAATAKPSASQRVEGGALVEPSIRPTSAASPTSSAPRAAQSSGTLCREYYSFFAHPEPQASQAAEAALGEKLDKLAGGPPKVFTYCFPYLDYLSWGKVQGTTSAAAQATRLGDPVATATPDPSPNDANYGAGSPGAGKPGAGDSVTGKFGAGGSGSQTGSGQG